MPHLACLTTLLMNCVLAECPGRGDAILERYQPETTQAAPSPKSEEKADAATDFEAVIRELGAPVAFERVFAEVQLIPRFKEGSETDAQFTQRQNAARAACKERYLIAAPVDFEHVRYDAEKQVLVVEAHALTKAEPTSGELGAAFGYESELHKARIEVEYGTLSSGRVMWTFPRERKDTGTYEGTNEFGSRAIITRQEELSQGVFERKGGYDESVWASGTQAGSSSAAFEIKADPEKAESLKKNGLRAAILVVPKAPFYATGTEHFKPTERDPFDRTINVRYLIGDIQCAAIFDADGTLLMTRATR